MKLDRIAVVVAAVTLVAGGVFAGAAYADAQPIVPLATDCSKTHLELHNGFQDAPRCVTTADGEVSAFDKNPTLLIVDKPNKIREGEDFVLKVSTRNLVRDRFLGAAAGGYYLETSLLNAAGLTRGHFHTGCRVVALNGADPKEAPAPSRSLFFLATEDGAGSDKPDIVKITVKGKDATGKALFPKRSDVQCAVWAGDGSHRIPMMQFANEIPAFDSVTFDNTKASYER